MNKLTVLGLVWVLLVSAATKSNETVNTNYNLEQLTRIPIAISISPKQIDFRTESYFRELKNNLQKEETLKDYSNFIYERYRDFKYSAELPQILKHAKIVDIEPELLMAIRLAENGRDSLAYGILPQGKLKEKYENERGYYYEEKFYPYTDTKEKQLKWATQTVRYYYEIFEKNPKDHKDFISYLASRYAPIGVKNDPNGLNHNWQNNVRFFYKKFKNFNP